MLALIGPSGRGKTSVVLAGILPALRISDNLSGLKRFYFPLLLPGSDPLASLAEMIDHAGNNSKAAGDSIKSLLRNSDYLLEAIKKTTDLPAVIVVDQLDDLFTLSDDRKQQRAFLMNLLNVVQAPEPKHTVIFTMRSDTYDDQIEKLSRNFNELFKSAKWVLPPLGADEIGDAIQKPAGKVGLKIAEPAVLALIKEILNEPIGLPLLQFTLLKLWAKREVNVVPEKALRELGGCRVSFVRAAEELYGTLNEEEKSTARRILMNLVKVNEDNHLTVVQALRADLFRNDRRERVESVLQRLVDGGLVRLTENKERDIQVELVHGSLIRGWNEMASWVGSRKSRQQVVKYVVRAMVTLLILAGAVLIAGAFVRSREDNKRRLSHFFASRSSELLRTRNELLKTRDHYLALLLGLHAYRLTDDAETRGSVFNALWETPRPIRFLFKTTPYVAGGLALSPDKKLLATFDEKGKVSIWNLENEPSIETPLPESLRASYPLVFSPDGRKLAWTSSIRNEDDDLVPDPQSNITLWDVSSGTATHMFVDEHYRAESLAFSPQSDVLMAGGADGRVFRWALGNKSPDQQPLITLSGSVTSVNFDSQGNWLACGSSDGSVVLWNRNKKERDSLFEKQGKGRQKVEQISGPAEVMSVSFSPDGKLLAIDRVKDTTVWDLARKVQIAGIPNENVERVSVFNEDNETLTSYNTDGTLVLLDLVNNSRIGEQLYAKIDASRVIAFSKDGKILAVPRDDGITLWDISGHRPLVASDRINDIAFSPNTTTLAAGLGDGRIILWDTVNRRRIDELDLSQPDQPASFLAFNSDGKTLAVGLLNSVIFWDVTKRATVGEPSKFEGSLESLVFRPDGQTLAATYDESNPNTLTLWNVVDRKRVGSLPKQEATVTGASFDSSGTRLATAHKDGTVRIWDVDQLALTPVNQRGDTAIIAGGVISRIAFSPDGKTLAFLTDPDSATKTGSGQGNVLIWDVETNTQVAHELAGHDGTVLGFAFRSDGKVLASSSADGEVILWDMDAKSGAEQFCRIANTNLSRKEWNTYVGEDKEYCRICEKFPAGQGAPQDAPACEYTWWSLLW